VLGLVLCKLVVFLVTAVQAFVLYLSCSWIWFSSMGKVIGFEDPVFGPVKRIAGMIVFKMTYNVASEMLQCALTDKKKTLHILYWHVL